MSPPGGREVGALLAWLVLLALPGVAVAATSLEATADAGAELHLVVRNTGDEAARDVTPRLVYRHRTATGDGVTLDPGTSHDWRFPLPPLPGPGTFPATVRVDHVDASGRAPSTPFVVVVPSDGTEPSPVRAGLEVEPIAGVAHGRLTLVNTASRPIAGRVVFVLPGGMSTEPESLPAEIAPGGRTIVPFAIQTGRSVPAGRYPAYTIFEYDQDAEHRTIVATAELAAVEGRSRPARPLLVGLGALGVTFALLAVAWRRAARRA